MPSTPLPIERVSNIAHNPSDVHPLEIEALAREVIAWRQNVIRDDYCSSQLAIKWQQKLHMLEPTERVEIIADIINIENRLRAYRFLAGDKLVTQ